MVFGFDHRSCLEFTRERLTLAVSLGTLYHSQPTMERLSNEDIRNRFQRHTRANKEPLSEADEADHPDPVKHHEAKKGILFR